MRVLVVTIVHHPDDARIRHRQIAALLSAGHSVTFAAPFSATGIPLPDDLRPLDLPRAKGRDRGTAIRAAAAMLRREARNHDIVLLHDPELLLSAVGLRHVPIVWDVHEDTAAALTMKAWLPGAARRPAGRAVQLAERFAEHRHHLLLAEDGYIPRFRHQHPVVPNSTPAPATVIAPGTDRVIYVGSLTRARGTLDMIELARRLGPGGPRLHLVGPADAESTRALDEAAGLLTWHGFLPNAQALALVDGALAGISLLHDEPNYRHSRPTKVMEYMAHGVPVISTPTPPAAALLASADCGIVVPFGDAGAAASAVQQLLTDGDLRGRLASNGRSRALRDHDWNKDGAEFVAILERWAAAT